MSRAIILGSMGAIAFAWGQSIAAQVNPAQATDLTANPSPTSESTAPREVDVTAEFQDVTPSGTRLRTEHRRVAVPAPSATSNVSSLTPRGASDDPANSGSSASALVASHGALWTRSDPSWIGKCVSIGVQGTQVFTEFEFGQDHSELLSGFDQTPATPVWSHAVPVECSNTSVDSAETADVHVSIHQLVLNGQNATRQSIVSKYTSHSSTPDWSFTFPVITSSVARVGVSRDGQRIVAASPDLLANKLWIAVFGANSGTPLYYGSIDNFSVALRGFELSQDGSTLYVASQTMASLWNVNTHQNAWQIVFTNGSFDCHALSGNGSVFSYGGFNFVDVWERTATGTYAKTYTRNLPGSYVCGRIAISSDSSTVAYTFNGYDTANHVRIEALDVATKQVTMSDEAVGTGTLQNVTGDMAIDADGGRFVVGLWGDGDNVCPEVRLYRKNQNAPVALFNLPGSVYDVDMSADGERIAVASKAVHANLFAGGGSISLYAFEPQDIRASGIPTPGSVVQFELSGPPHSPARLLWSSAAATNPTVFSTYGTLFLDRTTLHTVAIPAADASGSTTAAYQLPASAAQIGSTIYFQGLFAGPRRLTNDWVRVTILP